MERSDVVATTVSSIYFRIFFREQLRNIVYVCRAII